MLLCAGLNDRSGSVDSGRMVVRVRGNRRGVRYRPEAITGSRLLHFHKAAVRMHTEPRTPRVTTSISRYAPTAGADSSRFKKRVVLGPHSCVSTCVQPPPERRAFRSATFV